MKALLCSLALMAAVAQGQAQTTATDPWVRGTVAQQKATGLFVQLTSAQGAKLVAGNSPVAERVEIHEMTMVNDVMKMRQIDELPLPAGKAVALKPGGYHLMLMDLKQPLAAGAVVPVSLVIEGSDGKRETLTLQAPVRALGAAPMKHGH